MFREISVRSARKEELIDITASVRAVLRELNCKDGAALVYTPHTTAAITINENADPDVPRDILHGLGQIVPEKGYRHGEGNSPAHIKSSLVGCSEQIIVKNGDPVLGTWQGIFFCEFDGPRDRRVFIQAL